MSCYAKHVGATGLSLLIWSRNRLSAFALRPVCARLGLLFMGSGPLSLLIWPLHQNTVLAGSPKYLKSVG
jgi:hypothetical protein